MNEIDWFEAQTGLKVPEEFRAFCDDDEKLPALNFRIGLSGASEVAELFNFQGCKTSTMFVGWCKFRDRVLPKMIPIGFDIGDNLICLDSKSGEVVWSNHESDEAVVLSESFRDFVVSLEPESEEPGDPIEKLAEFGSKEEAVAFLGMNKRAAVSSWNRSLAQESCRFGNLDVLKACFEAGDDLSGCIHFAAMNGNLAVVQFLAEVARVDINERNSNGWVPLQCAKNDPAIYAYLKNRQQL